MSSHSCEEDDDDDVEFKDVYQMMLSVCALSWSLSLFDFVT